MKISCSVLRTLVLALLAFCSPLACINEGSVGGASTALPDVAGTYTISLSYKENGCLLDSWQEGSVLNGVVLELEQEAADLSGTVQGITGGVLALIHGSNIYRGTLEGAHADMTIFGQYPGSEGNCSFSLNNELSADFDGDFMNGTLAFVKQGNGNPDCGAVECQSLIRFNGARAPRD